MRLGSPQANRLHQGIILTMSSEPLDLPAAPLKFLLRLRQMAGHSRRLVTYTSSLAKIMDCSVNTIRNWRDVLVDAGYIHWQTSPRTGQTSIYITERVEPPSRRAKAEEQRRIDALPEPLPWQPPKPVALPPDPRPWWKTPAKSAFCTGGAQQPTPIKTRQKKEADDSSEPQPKVEPWNKKYRIC